MNEHIPVGVLVAAINSNELQALSDEYPDELWSASLACRKALSTTATPRMHTCSPLQLTVAIHLEWTATLFDPVWLT